ncbi:MAG: hypothetical protein ACREER_13360, partial [Alphaproteobacteria bacterium]
RRHVPSETSTAVAGQASAVREFESRVAHRDLAPGATDPAASQALSKRPLSFQFHWRDRRFVASLINHEDGGSRLAVTSHLNVGGEAERRPAREHSLVFALATHAESTTVDFKLIRGGDVVLSDTFAIKCYAGLSVDNLVAKLTAALLMSAPYLDLLSEAPETLVA